ncbi:MAG: substrate-binding domain-containing protein [Capsulimonadaceae bacterium]|nr:substrate-binding domain-containing protein [Capsulimonadaceae bacterium]
MKYQQVAESIKNRVNSGEFLATGIPAERELAALHGVSYMTARRAVEQLIAERTLARKSNGRIEAITSFAGSPSGRLPSIAFLAPSWRSEDIGTYRSAVVKAASARGLIVKTIVHTDIAERVVTETLIGYDAVFFLPFTDPMPESVIDCIRKTGRRVIGLNYDLSRYGIPSIVPLPSTSVRRLLDHLASMGHERIHCVNTQPIDTVNREWIGQWRLWRSMRGANGTLYDYPEPIGGDPRSVAYELIRRLLSDDAFDATALLCTTIDCAEGCMRALREAGITIGGQVSVCTVNSEMRAQYLHPTMTSVTMIDPTPYFAFCLDWILENRTEWQGPMVLSPIEAPLFIGESTAPAPESRTGHTSMLIESAVNSH